MRCTVCGHENEADRKFCGQCGTRLSVACPACGHANPPADLVGFTAAARALIAELGSPTMLALLEGAIERGPRASTTARPAASPSASRVPSA